MALGMKHYAKLKPDFNHPQHKKPPKLNSSCGAKKGKKESENPCRNWSTKQCDFGRDEGEGRRDLGWEVLP